MKNLRITVNGTAYDVQVEELGGSSAPVAAAPAPAAAPAGAAGSVQVTAPMPGKVVAVKASVGQAVKKGEVVLVLEAMKMETIVVSTIEGVVDKIYVKPGETVHQDDLMMSFQ